MNFFNEIVNKIKSDADFMQAKSKVSPSIDAESHVTYFLLRTARPTVRFLNNAGCIISQLMEQQMG